MPRWKAIGLLLISTFGIIAGQNYAHAFFWEPFTVQTRENVRLTGKSFKTRHVYKNKRKFRIENSERPSKSVRHSRNGSRTIARRVRLAPLPPVRPFEFPGIKESSPAFASAGREKDQLLPGGPEPGPAIAPHSPKPIKMAAARAHLDNCDIPNSEKRRRITRSISAVLEEELENVAIVVLTAREFSVPIELALAVAFHESRIDSCAISHTGVRGVMQVTKRTASWLGYDRNNNVQNIKAGVKLLGRIVADCGATNYRCIAAQYNGSTRRERSQWAIGVQIAHRSFKSTVAVAIETGDRILAGAEHLGKWLFKNREQGKLPAFDFLTS